MSDLLPCPFCGGDAYTETYIVEAAAGCRECQFKVTRGHRPYEYDGLPKAIAAWNRRALPAVQPMIGDPVTLTYTNWRGEAAQRTIIPQRVWFGSTDWHPEPQWLLTALDTEKGAERDFALKDFGSPAVQPDLTDPIVVHANMLRGTVAKPTLDQIIHLYGVDALCRALVPAICREAALDETARLGQEFDAALKGESHG